VPAYWIVDLDARLVEAWTPDSDRPVIAAETISWQPDARNAALEVELPRFFADLWDQPAP
jgi:hypothetical protein